MTCKQLRAYRDDSWAAIDLQSDSAQFAEHLAICSECSRVVREQEELAKSLREMRDSAPTVPACVDRAVLAKFRAYVAGESRARVPVSLRARINLREAVGMAVALTFAAIVAYGAMLLFFPAQRSWMDRSPTPRQPIGAPQTMATVSKPIAAERQPARKQPKSFAPAARHRNYSASVSGQDGSVPTRFQTLMYCDPISCPGTMEIIRVQLTSPVLGVAPGWARANGVISAEVLVGPDGIARGIRVVE